MSQSPANLPNPFGSVTKSDYEFRLYNVTEFCTRSVDIGLMQKAIPPTREGAWEDLYLSGLYRQGLMLTQNIAYTMMGDNRYPNGVPVRAPRPTPDDPDVWPSDTWIIYRD